MTNQAWSELSPLQLGHIAERYAIIEFLSREHNVFTPEIDDRGVDFVVKSKSSGRLLEVQVKAVRKCNYAFIRKDKMPLDDQRLVRHLRFNDGRSQIPTSSRRPAGKRRNPKERWSLAITISPAARANRSMEYGGQRNTWKNSNSIMPITSS